VVKVVGHCFFAGRGLTLQNFRACHATNAWLYCHGRAEILTFRQSQTTA
jgi:hypothetical protein